MNISKTFVDEEIYDLIPNRKPLMILDKITVDNERAVSEITLEEDDWFFKCHFPGNPVLPFTLLIESMAQTFESVVCYNINSKEIPLTIYMSEFNLRTSCSVGDKLQINASLCYNKRGIYKGKVFALLREEIIAEINITQVVPSEIVSIR